MADGSAPQMLPHGCPSERTTVAEGLSLAAMPRSAALIQTEITSIENQLAAIVSASSYSAGGKSKTNQQYDALTRRLDDLYVQLDRATGAAPMFTRGRVTGMGGTL